MKGTVLGIRQNITDDLEGKEETCDYSQGKN
jgi:hypothetical protein